MEMDGMLAEISISLFLFRARNYLFSFRGRKVGGDLLDFFAWLPRFASVMETVC